MITDGDPTEMLKRVSREILPLYGMEAASVDPIADSNELVLRVVGKDDQQYVLRLQDPEDMPDSAVRTQLDWLNSILDETHIVVPRPVALKSGQPFGAITVANRPRPFRFVLLVWLEGQRKSTPSEWVEHDNLVLIGKVVARLHEHSKQHDVPQDCGVPVLNAAAFLGESCALRRNEAKRYLGGVDLERFYRHMDVVRAALVECVEREEERGLIHADLGPHNWVFFEGVPSIIDFDAFAVGYFVHDLLGVLWSHSHWDGNEEYVKSLFAGYETVRCIADNVKANVFSLQAAHCLMWINWVLSMKNGRMRDELVRHIPHQVQIVEKLCGKGNA